MHYNPREAASKSRERHINNTSVNNDIINASEAVNTRNGTSPSKTEQLGGFRGEPLQNQPAA